MVEGEMPPLSPNRRQSAEFKTAIQLAARRRVEAVWACLDVLCPDITPQAKKELAGRVLDLSRGEDRATPRLQIQITPAQVESIFWPNIQCIKPRCPMLLFSNQIADELNEFFKQQQ